MVLVVPATPLVPLPTSCVLDVTVPVDPPSPSTFRDALYDRAPVLPVPDTVVPSPAMASVLAIRLVAIPVLAPLTLKVLESAPPVSRSRSAELRYRVVVSATVDPPEPPEST